MKVGVYVPLPGGWDGFQARVGQVWGKGRFGFWSVSFRSRPQERMDVTFPDFRSLPGWKPEWELGKGTDLWAVLLALRSNGPWSGGFGQWEGQAVDHSEVRWQWSPNGRPADPPYPGFPMPQVRTGFRPEGPP